MVDDYEIKAVLHEGCRYRVCLANRRGVSRQFILKSPQPGCRDNRVVARLEHEHRILRLLALDPNSEIAFESIGGFPTLVRPATNAGPLSVALGSVQNRNILSKLRLARNICRSLEQIHQAGVIHKDINPNNILWDPETDRVEIIDFDISTQLRGEASELAPPENLEGTLAYISPEQTGRTRLTIDQRADLYSLGATLYQIFSGQLPFEASDLAKMVHAHLAVVPLPLSKLRPELPLPVSDIVAKLMTKEPEDRYQTATGLAVDLERCIERLERGEPLERFELGQKDSLGLFRISDRLYGREHETNLLLDSFHEVVGGNFRLLLISGYSGIGKSSLIHQIQTPVIKWKAYYASGKFDQLQRDVPYATLVQAMKGLIRQILKGTSADFEKLKAEILEAVGDNGKLLIEVIPEIELIIGEQAEVPALSPAESQNRFYRVLTRFIRVFAKREHPLVFFLDDLQWTDAATLEVISRMAASDDFPYLLLIGAYRDSEVDATHPLRIMLERLQQGGTTWQELRLKPLDLKSVAMLIGDTLQCDPARAETLAALCAEKTGGNPFFLGQFLKSIRDNGLVHFEKRLHRWEWDVEQIRSQQFTENVIDLMTRQIRELPDKTQGTLRLAACIGSSFDLKTLSIVAREDASECLSHLWSALNESLILPENSAYRYAGLGASDSDPDGAEADVRFRFLHDRVQEACYALIPNGETAPLHLEIGRLLLQNLSKQEAVEQCFGILLHYNAGISCITRADEKMRLARLNLAAGRRARAAAAYRAALDYFEIGLALLNEESWASNYSLCFDLHVGTIEARYFCHDDPGMESLAAEVLKRVSSPVDRAAVEQLRIQALMGRNEPVAAIRLALVALRELGVRLPSKPNKLHTVLGLLTTEYRLRKKPVEELLDLPEMSDPEKLAAIRILYFVFSSAYFAMPAMYPLIMFEIIRISLAYGNTSASAIGYAVYGVVQCGLLRRIDYANRFGRLSLDLVEKLGARQIKPRVIQVTQGFITVYRTHPRELLADFLEGYKTGLEVGDFEFASFTAHMRCFFLLWTGTPLRTVDAEMRKYTSAIEELNQTIPLYQQKLWHQLVANLLGESKNPVKLIGEIYNENAMVSVHEQANDAIALFFLQCCKVFLGVLFEDISTAISAAVRGGIMNREGVGMGSTTVPMFFEWSALAWLDAYRTGATDLPPRKMLKNAKTCLKALEKWAECAPAHAEYRSSLVRAELSDIEGRHGDAIRHYQESLRQARNHRSPIDVAVACHRMGNYFNRQDISELAHAYIMEAGIEYSRWQATSILAHLEKQYPDLGLTRRLPDGHSSDSAEAFARLARSTWTTGTVSTARSQTIDLVSVVKSAQALSGEINLERLLQKIMHLMMENAGANRGVLILLKKGRMVIEAETTEDGSTTVLKSLPLDEEQNGRKQPRVAREVVNFVARTRNTVILEDASRLGDFTTDPYIAEHQSRSIIVIPLANKGNLSGLLHLENTVVRSAFSLERVDVLASLSAHVAIALENARLYSDLDALNQSYARFVPHQFLDILKKSSITDVKIGDGIQGNMTILFCDIGGFTGISEALSPEATFDLVNRYLRHMEPAISGNGGIIDKFIGDAILSIFPGEADSAVCAALQMIFRLRALNEELKMAGHAPLFIGIGINTGNVMLGVVGGEDRLDTTVISDAVNLSARLESMTRYYNVPLLISDYTRKQLKTTEFTNYIRRIDRVIPRGKSSEVDVYEVFAADPPAVREAKIDYDADFQQACTEFYEGERGRAERLFRSLLNRNPSDRVLQCYLERTEIIRQSDVLPIKR